MTRIKNRVIVEVLNKRLCEYSDRWNTDCTSEAQFRVVLDAQIGQIGNAWDVCAYHVGAMVTDVQLDKFPAKPEGEEVTA